MKEVAHGIARRNRRSKMTAVTGRSGADWRECRASRKRRALICAVLRHPIEDRAATSSSASSEPSFCESKPSFRTRLGRSIECDLDPRDGNSRSSNATCRSSECYSKSSLGFRSKFVVQSLSPGLSRRRSRVRAHRPPQIECRTRRHLAAFFVSGGAKCETIRMRWRMDASPCMPPIG
jgi:hypothetical protein